MPPGFSAAWSSGPGIRFQRAGTDTIAGMPCTVWRRITPPPRPDGSFIEPGAFCFTADGVMLREEYEGVPARQAVSVTYAPQNANRFVPPPGYRRMTFQQLAPLAASQ
jgi:hypothetical protein